MGTRTLTARAFGDIIAWGLLAVVLSLLQARMKGTLLRPEGAEPDQHRIGAPDPHTQILSILVPMCANLRLA